MCQKAENHAKLNQVYNEITSIKAQIYNLMQPNPPLNSHTLLTNSNAQQNQKKLPIQLEKEVVMEVIKKQSQKDGVIKGAKYQPQYTSLKYLRSPFNKPKNQTDSTILYSKPTNPFTGQAVFNKNTHKFPIHPKQTYAAKFTPSYFKKVEQLKHDAEAEALRIQPQHAKLGAEKSTKIRFFHTRHKSQAQMNNHKQLSKSKSNQKLPTYQQKQKEVNPKHSFLNKGLTNTIKEEKQEKSQKQDSEVNTKTKRLMRMCSDLTELSQNSQKRYFSVNKSQKLRALEAEIKKKDEIIQLLSTELQQIQRNFNQMEASLRKILLTRVPESKQVQQGQVSLAIEQMCKQLQQNRMQIRTLKVQNQTIHKKVADFQQQKADLKNILQNLASKLEIAVNQNKLKDQFIINYLLAKNKDHQRVAWVSQTLQNFIDKTGYPNNRLLQKLCSERQQIHQLQKIIQNLSKPENVSH